MLLVRNGSKVHSPTCKLVTCANMLNTRRDSMTRRQHMVSMVTIGLRYHGVIVPATPMEHVESRLVKSLIIINCTGARVAHMDKKVDDDDGFQSHVDIW